MNEPVQGYFYDAGSEPDVADIAARLQRGRPEPGSALRGKVRAFLTAVDASGLLIARPRRLWVRVAACAIAGAVLLALVAVGLGHFGPFAR